MRSAADLMERRRDRRRQARRWRLRPRPARARDPFAGIPTWEIPITGGLPLGHVLRMLMGAPMVSSKDQAAP